MAASQHRDVRTGDRRGSADPLGDFLDAAERLRLHEFGFVLYPLHSFGVLQDDWAFVRGRGAAEVVFEYNGIAVTPQLNSEENVASFLRRVAPRIGVEARLPLDLLEMHLRHPVLKWVTDNPLMIIRVRSYSGGQYENQDAYAAKLALGTALVMMASVLTDPREDVHAVVSSTARVNNFETLDIRHYLVFENAARGRRLGIRRVPMNLAPQTLAQLSDLAVDLDPDSWKVGEVGEEIDRLSRAVASYEPFRARHLPGTGARARVGRKLFDSIFWFRRSFNSVADPREAVVALAVAFEALLTDSYGATDALLAGVAVGLAGTPDQDHLVDQVARLFRARGQAVHLGAISGHVDLRLARRAYVRCFMHIADRLHAAPHESSAPIAEILRARAS